MNANNKVSTLIGRSASNTDKPMKNTKTKT